MSKMNVPEQLAEEIRHGHRFLITSHLNPDGDAIGSEVGLSRILRTLGKGAKIWNRDPTPPLFRPLPGSDHIHVGTEPPAGYPEAFDRIVVLECPEIDRCGLENLDSLPVLNIDHHLGNDHYGKVNWVDSAAPAVGEMILRLAKSLRAELDEETATALLLTIVSDTGGFRFSNSTPAAFEAAAELVRLGGRPEWIAQWLYESRSLASLRLLEQMLPTLQVAPEDPRIATALLTTEMFEQAGASSVDTEGLVDYPRSVAGVEVAGLLRQTDASRWKISLRSRGAVDVQKLALRHEGGGHRNAAGCYMEGAGEEVRRRLVEEIRELLR